MKIKTAFPNISDSELNNILLENNLNQGYNFKQKLYYNILRPVISKNLRKKLQHRYNEKVEFYDSFINEKFVESKLGEEVREKGFSKLYPNNYTSALLLTHDVEEEEGLRNIPKILELEEKYGFKSSWNIVPYKYPIDMSIIRLIRESGHEIGIHGYNHDGKLFSSEKEFNKRAPFINDALKKYDAVGFRAPMVHRNLDWISKLNILYDSSTFDYDPFQPYPGGNGFIWPFIYNDYVELPYTLPQDHTLFYVLKQDNIDIWKKKADWLIENNGIVLLLTHPDYLIEPKHTAHYEEMLKFLSAQNEIWSTLPKKFAQHIRDYI